MQFYTYLNQQPSNLIMAHCYVHIDKLMLETTTLLLVVVFLVLQSIVQEIASFFPLFSPAVTKEIILAQIQNENPNLLWLFCPGMVVYA